MAEVLIAVVIGSLLMTAASATYVSQTNSYVAQDSVSEVNSQSLIAHGLISDTVRGAGFGMPDNLAANPINGFTDIVTPIDGLGGSDAVTILTGRMLGQLWPVGVGPGMMACNPHPPVGGNPLTQVYGNPSGIVAYDVVLAGTLTPNTGTMSNVSIDAIEYADIVSVGGFTVNFSTSLGAQYPLIDNTGDGNCDTGRPVYLIEDVTFCLDANLTLRRIRYGGDPVACTGTPAFDEAIAENIVDFQLAYAIDANGDGQIDDLDGDNMLSDGDFAPAGVGVVNADIRAIRINVVGRTDKPDPNFLLMGNPPALVENNALGQPNDSFKYRWWQKIVKIRNL